MESCHCHFICTCKHGMTDCVVGSLITTESTALHHPPLRPLRAPRCHACLQFCSTVSSSKMVLWLPCGKHTTLAMYEPNGVMAAVWYTVQAHLTSSMVLSLRCCEHIRRAQWRCGSCAASTFDELNGGVAAVRRAHHIFNVRAQWCCGCRVVRCTVTLDEPNGVVAAVR